MLYKPGMDFIKEITGGAELGCDKRATTSHQEIPRGPGHSYIAMSQHSS